MRSGHRPVDHEVVYASGSCGGSVPALPSWLIEPLWDQFAALLPPREIFVSTHPWGCHRRRIADRVVFDKLIQGLGFGCSYEGIADSTCSATTVRTRRDEWIGLGVFAALARIARQAYDRIVGLVLDEIAVDGCITQAPGGGEVAGPSPVDRRKQGMKRSVLVEGYGIPLAGSWPVGSATTPRCWRPPWTCSTISARYLRTSPCTSMPATTRAKPATPSPIAGCPARSHARARRHPSRPASVGTSSARTPGTTRSTGSNAA